MSNVKMLANSTNLSSNIKDRERERRGKDVINIKLSLAYLLYNYSAKTMSGVKIGKFNGGKAQR